MKKIQLTILFLLFSIITNAQIYVDVTALGSNNGTTWVNAYTSLTTALANAVSGNEIWVAKGTYKPTNETSPFSIPANVKIYGGFNGTETLLTERDWFRNPTILSGDLDSSTTANTGDAHTIVHFNTVNDAEINGFTIEYGYADNDATLLGRTGAGIYNEGNNKITNCVINNNNAFGNGTNNGVGGGTISFSGILEITNTVFHSNNASASGGAISVESGTANLINATIANNTATKGGGVHFFNGSMTAVNSIFTNNSGTNGNINNDGGAGTGSVSYCLFFNATATNNGNIPPSITDTGNNLENTDPLYGGRAAFSLLVNSPALDAGDNTANTTTKGLGNNNRILDADFNSTATIDIGAYEADVIYTEITGTSLVSVYSSSVKFGDIDNDGDLDILLTGDGSTSNTSKTYTNDGAGNYTLKANPIALFSQRSVAFGDIDNDGDLDIILTGSSGDPISKMYTNDGAGNYTERTYPFIYYLYDAHSSSIAFGDIDNDGDLDMLIVGFGSGSRSKTYINDGTGNYTIKANPLTGVGNSSVAFGDIDNDGDLDILLTGDTGSGNISKTYINDGAANYTEKPNPLTGVRYSSVAFGDIDNDGDLDILLTGDSGSGNISNIYTNDGTGNYTEKTNPLIGVKYSSAAFGDIDNDGDLDILLTGDTGSVNASKIYTNDGAGNYTESTHQLTNVSSSSVVFGDIDNDGDLDILLTGHPGSAAISKLYKNNTITANTAPTAPTSPTAVVNPNNTVTLSWSASTDAQTASSGLSYAIYIKENPVGTPIYVKSPMAQEADGWRKLSALGNTMQNTNYTYKLPASYCATITNFTFKVQAIDHNFTGSAFSSEGSFTVDLTTPSITTIFVKADATGTNDGTSWANAFTDLENAITNLNICTEEVWVAQGTYKPSSESASFLIPANIKMYGGFNGTETLLTERDYATNPTILSGDLDNSNTATIGDVHTIVHITKDNVIIDGFILEKSYADGTTLQTDSRGGAIYNSGADLRITNCIFRNNTVIATGGTEGLGGAISNYNTIHITNSLFYNNTAGTHGGAIHSHFATLNLTNVTIANNTATNVGGAIYAHNSDVTAINTIFSNNSGSRGNIYVDGTATRTVSYSLFYNTTAGNNGSIPLDVTDGGNNIINTDPVFKNTASNDFRLSIGSPVLNFGDNSSISYTKDLENKTRIFDTTIDIGAFEFDEIVSSWTGAISTAWSLAGNWTRGTPTSSTSVLISDNTNIATIYSGTTANAKNIIINAAKSLFINGEGSLTIDGNLTNNGLLKAFSGSSIIVNGTATGIINYFRNLATTNWYLISNPLKNETTANIRSNNSLAVSVSAPNMGLATYNNNNSSWEYYTLSNINAGGVLPSGKGYSTKLGTAEDFEFEGEMPTDNVAIAITNGTANKFNLIGNPYPSYIPANESAHLTNNILTVNTAQLSENTLWFWDESLNGGSGAYTQINHATSSRFIAPGQGFFVKSKVGGGTFSFTETMQSHQATDVFNRSTTNRFEINLSISDGTTIKNTEIYYINGTTTGFDNGYDSSIFGGINNAFALYTHTVINSEGRKLGIQSLPDANYENIVIPVGINAVSGTEITFSVATQNIPNGINIYLENKIDNTFTQLNNNGNYTITLSADSNGIGQFYLHTTSSVLGIKTVSLQGVSIYKTTNTNLRIVGLTSGKASIKICTLLGRKVFQTTFESTGIKDIRLPNVSTGVYLIHLQTVQGNLTKKIVIR